MINVLFVDDEADVLEGLENRLRPWRSEWHLMFAGSGDEALAAMRQRHVDVVVSDMRMPGMDGASLLRAVRERQPETVRIILSGQADREGVMRSLPVAHQFLSKPCDARRLHAIISRCRLLQDELFSDAVKQAIASVSTLPALPRLYWELAEELDRPAATLKRVAAIIEQDVAMTARLLQVVNSAFFAFARPICSVRDAVTLLGLEPVRALVLTSELFRGMAPLCLGGGLDLERLHGHALRVATIAETLPEDPQTRTIAMAAGMLHDIGLMVLSLPPQRPDVAAPPPLPLHCAEQQPVFGTSHALVGGHLLALWGLPQPLVEAVAFHHRPSLLDDLHLSAAGAVHIADWLAHELAGSHAGQGGDEALDSAYLSRIDRLHCLPQWLERHRGSGDGHAR